MVGFMCCSVISQGSVEGTEFALGVSSRKGFNLGKKVLIKSMEVLEHWESVGAESNSNSLLAK